jgi:hypothetical protein
MKHRRRLTLFLVLAVILLASVPPAAAGVHLWRITEAFSNADGTIQFIEMTTCCGSAGGEVFVGSQHLRSSSGGDFIFPGNLSAGTNKHILLATDGYAALPGAPVRDYTIPAHFFSTAGDTLTFAVYDTWTIAAGALPTNGTSSLNKNEEDATDTPFVSLNSPTNLLERTGSVNAAGGPPGVPDGTGGTTPMMVALLTPDGSSLRISYDVASCTNASNHHLLFGQRSGFPAALGGQYTLLGGVCSVGNVSPYDWVSVPAPTDGKGLIWFQMVATDSGNVEGSWGKDSAGGEPTGPGNGGASVVCSLVKNSANACGHNP